MERDEPDLEIEIQQTADQGELFTDPERPEGAVSIPLEEWIAVDRSGNIIVTGCHIPYIRNYPDGTQDIIYVDG